MSADYLVTWMGYVTGSPGGREDGYPEQKQALVKLKDLYYYADFPEVKLYAIAELTKQASEEIFNQCIAVENKKAAIIKDKKKQALAKLTTEEQALLQLQHLK